MNKIEIRECVSFEDKRKAWDAFYQLYPNESHGIESVDAYVEKVSKYARIIVAYDGDTVVGFVAFYANDAKKKIAYITQILVLREYQKHKIGKQLLNACEAICKRQKFNVIRLEVNICNHDAIGFYNHIGFYEEIKNNNSIYMIKEI